MRTEKEILSLLSIGLEPETPDKGIETDLSGGVQAGTRPGQNSPLHTDCLRDNRHVENVSIPKEGATRNSGSSAPPAQSISPVITDRGLLLLAIPEDGTTPAN